MHIYIDCLYGTYFDFFLRTFLDRIFSVSNSGQRVEIAICKDWKLVYALNHLQLKRLYLHGVEIRVLI